jgi:hypothetical protein
MIPPVARRVSKIRAASRSRNLLREANCAADPSENRASHPSPLPKGYPSHLREAVVTAADGRLSCNRSRCGFGVVGLVYLEALKFPPSGVSLTRVLGQEYFPTDVLVGGTAGWLIGHYVFEKHHLYHATHAVRAKLSMKDDFPSVAIADHLL